MSKQRKKAGEKGGRWMLAVADSYRERFLRIKQKRGPSVRFLAEEAFEQYLGQAELEQYLGTGRPA